MCLAGRRARGDEFEALAAKCAGAYSLAALHLNEGSSSTIATTTPPINRSGGGGAKTTTTATTDNNKSRLISRAGSLKQPNPLIHTTDHPKRFYSAAASKESVAHEPRLGGTAKARCRKDQLPMSSRLNNRLSSSVGEVLHEGASDIEELCDLDIARPITACGVDRTLSYLQYVHDNQARRMRSRSEWFLSPNGSKSVDLCFTGVITPPPAQQEPPPPPPSVPLQKSRAPLQSSSKSNMSSNDSLARQQSDRRKSLKFRTAAFAAHPSHSLDYPDSTNRYETSRLRSHTSVEAETWLTDVVSTSHDEEIPKKRRSLKKKTSTKF